MVNRLRDVSGALAVVTMLIGSGAALGHGSLATPQSRIYNAFTEGPESPISDAVVDAVAIGGTQPLYDWNELVNFHPGTNAQQRVIDYSIAIPDGQLASAGNAKFAGFDQVRDDWPSTDIESGPFEFVWYATTPHDPSVHRLWITTQDWDPTMPLDWAHMEEIPIGPVGLDGAEYRFNAILPYRTGKQVLYVIWQRLDPVGEGFYAVADVDFGQSPDTTQCVADFNGDFSVTATDLLLLISAWGSADELYDIVENGVIDVSDLIFFLSSWGTCGPDCDLDGTPDSVEIKQGALDCDADGIPDSCQDTSDCDGNGVPDICDLISGTHEDCNLNLVPDVCDLLTGDADENGILDECQFDGLSFSFDVTQSWDTGFQGALTIHNDEPQCVVGWELLFDVGFAVDQVWNGVLVSQEGQRVRIVNDDWNFRICSGKSVTIGFIATGLAGVPENLTLNGNAVPIAP
jgi:predicted carbohydrate-binding protein with CBM5 and CBM33 domain